MMTKKQRRMARLDATLRGLCIELKHGEFVSINDDECLIQYIGVSGGRLIFNAPKDKYKINRKTSNQES